MPTPGVIMAATDEGKGLPLVFVHGFPLSRGAWRRQVEGFSATHRVIAPDLRGFGDTPPVPGTSTMDRFAGDLHDLIQQRGTGPIVLAGHSMGGYIVLAFARHYPELLRGLVLVGTKAGPDTPEGAAGRRATAEKVQAEGTAPVIEAMAPKMIGRPATEAGLGAEVRGFMASASPQGVVGALLGMAERADATAGLAGIGVPTLVVTGDEDVLIPPAESEKLAKAIPGAVLRIIPGAGHLVAHEKPREFNLALKEWLLTVR